MVRNEPHVNIYFTFWVFWKNDIVGVFDRSCSADKIVLRVKISDWRSRRGAFLTCKCVTRSAS